MCVALEHQQARVPEHRKPCRKQGDERRGCRGGDPPWGHRVMNPKSRKSSVFTRRIMIAPQEIRVVINLRYDLDGINCVIRLSARASYDHFMSSEGSPVTQSASRRNHSPAYEYQEPSRFVADKPHMCGVSRLGVEGAHIFTSGSRASYLHSSRARPRAPRWFRVLGHKAVTRRRISVAMTVQCSAPSDRPERCLQCFNADSTRRRLFREGRGKLTQTQVLQ
jgi:hypothetical protein